MERDVRPYQKPDALSIKQVVTYQGKDFAKTLELLERAYSEGAHEKIPVKLSQPQWSRIINMVESYYYGIDTTTQDVGLRYGITREAARQSIKKGVLNLWQNTSPQTQELFPIETLCFRKPLSQNLRERRSSTHGGISLSIRDGLRAGKSIEQIQEENALSLSQICRSRPILSIWGVELPYRRATRSQNTELENKLRTAKTDEEKQEFLTRVKHAFYINHVAGENPILIPITTAIRNAGFYIENRRNTFLFLTPLTDSGFPVGHIPKSLNMPNKKPGSYHFFLSQDEERAKKIWLKDKNLHRFLI